MEVTNQQESASTLKNKVEIFFVKAIKHRKKRGLCMTRDVMAVLMDKWSLIIIYNLGYFGSMRFGELKGNIKDISSRMLSVTLKKLEAHNIIHRESFSEVPPRVEYRLTQLGIELADKTVDLNDWFLDNFAE